MNGVPAISYGGEFEVYYPDSTVVIFGDAAPKGYVAGFLVTGPSRLVTLAKYGLYFDEECLDESYCQADRTLTSQHTEFVTSVLLFYGFFFGIPFLIALFVARWWVFVLPFLATWFFLLGGSMGWFPTGESWELAAVVYILPIGLGVVSLGWILRRAFLRIRRSKRVPA